MPVYRVMFVKPVSCSVEVEVAEGITDPGDIADAAYQKLPGFTDQNWDDADPEWEDSHGNPYAIERTSD